MAAADLRYGYRKRLRLLRVLGLQLSQPPNAAPPVGGAVPTWLDAAGADENIGSRLDGDVHRGHRFHGRLDGSR